MIKHNRIYEKILKNIKFEIIKWFDKNQIEHDFSSFKKSEDYLFLFVEVANRFVPAIKWNVHESSEILTKISNGALFGDNLDAYQYIKGNLSRGIDINCHLSKSVFELDRKDGLKNDWNIKHIHLSKTEALTRFEMHNNRSSKILLAGFFKSDAYLIDVIDHPHGSQFANRDYLKTIVDNGWADYFDIDCISNSRLTTQFTDEEVYKLRNNQISAGAFEKDSCVYVPCNGITGAGTNSGDSTLVNLFLQKLDENTKKMSCCRGVFVEIMATNSMIHLVVDSGRREMSLSYPNYIYVPPKILI